MADTYRNCQSCGMPRARDEKGGGTEADGSKSDRFCSHCYQQGGFIQPDLTADQMKERVKGKLNEFGIPGFLSWIFTRNIPKLERWHSK